MERRASSPVPHTTGGAQVCVRSLDASNLELLDVVDCLMFFHPRRGVRTKPAAQAGSNERRRRSPEGAKDHSHGLTPPLKENRHPPHEIRGWRSQRWVSCRDFCRSGRHGAALRSGFANGRNTSANIQPSVLLKQAEQIVGVGNFSGDDLFPALIIDHGKSHLHWLLGRILLGEMDEFYVESFLLLRLHWHCFSLVPGWDTLSLRKKHPVSINNV